MNGLPFYNRCFFSSPFIVYWIIFAFYVFETRIIIIFVFIFANIRIIHRRFWTNMAIINLKSNDLFPKEAVMCTG